VNLDAIFLSRPIAFPVTKKAHMWFAGYTPARDLDTPFCLEGTGLIRHYQPLAQSWCQSWCQKRRFFLFFSVKSIF